MRFIYHPGALGEYADAALHYDERVPGLGADFTKEVDAAIARILQAPDRWRCLEDDIRRCLVHRFPYGVLYTIEEGYVLIVAVMHLSREPGYWRDRIPFRPPGA
ncbi:MAG: type II toxin-antitoxin system RelE/ParE family toxin [Verrucomicrobiota bacterium]|jgi:plasmid stabilization system protein ParE